MKAWGKSKVVIPTEYMNYINKLEEEYPVDKWTIADVHIWPLLRFSITNYLHDYEEKTAIQNNKMKFYKLKILFNIVKGLFQYLYACIKDLQHKAELTEADVIILGFSVDRVFYTPQKKWYDFLRDPFVEKFNMNGIKSLLLELSPQNIYKIPRYSKSHFIQPTLDLILVKSKVNRNVKDTNMILPLYDNFMNRIKKDYPGICPSIELNKLVERVEIIRKIANYFEKIITKTHASMGMVVCYYGDTGMAFNLACRRAGINSVDIQHGIAGELHRAYGRWAKVPREGYELLPAVFWCWSDYEKQSINRWNSNCDGFHSALEGKNLWIEKWKSSDNDFVSFYNKKFNKYKQQASKHILLTLSNGYDCPEFVLDTIRNSPPFWKWWIRLHPTMVKNSKEKCVRILSNSGCSIEDINFATEIPLMTLLKNVDVHVTGWSAVVYDALPFGVPSIVVHENGEKLFKNEIERDLVTVAYSQKALVRNIEKAKQKQEILENDNCRSDMAIDVLVKKIISKRSRL